MKNIELTFITDDIGNVKNCTINNNIIKLPEDKIEEIFNQFKRKYPNPSKSCQNRTHKYTFSDVDNDELSNLITTSLNYQIKYSNYQIKKYQKNMVISIVATLALIIFALVLGPSADLPLFYLIVTACTAINAFNLNNKIKKTNLNLSDITKINKKLLEDINAGQNKLVATKNSQTTYNHNQNKSTSSPDISLPLQLENEESKKDTKSYSYYKDKSTSPLDIPLDYQAENKEKDESSNDFDVLSVFEKQKKGQRR